MATALMPELPEVETIRRDLDAQIRGAAIVKVAVSRRWQEAPHTRFHENRAFRQRIVGGVVANIDRRSKYLLFRLSTDTIIIHLGMSGQLLLVESSARREAHTHAVFMLADSRELRFADPRMFGKLWVVASTQVEERLGHIGPEPLSRSFNGRALAVALANKTAPIKSALLNPRVVAGIGNIYSDEALFEAAIHPQRSSGSLRADEVQSLAYAIKVVLRRGIRRRGTTLSDSRYRDAFGAYGGHAPRVYGRSGEPCVRCQSPIARGIHGGRSFHYCPRCQK